MLRRAALVTFVSALLLVGACGRQITPEPKLSSNLAGHMLIRFRVNGSSLAFTSYDYQIVIDACGEGVPRPNPGANSSVKNYSYSFNVGTSPFGVTPVYPILLQYKLLTGLTGFTPLTVPISPSLISFVPNSNGQGNEFEIVFDREQLDNPKNLAQPCPSFTQPPASGAVAPGATAATSSPASTPSPAGATPVPKPTTPVQATWILNFIVLTPSGVPVDSLGQGGSSDNSYPGIVVDTQSQSQQQIVKLPDSSGAPPDPNAQIAGGEVDNYP